MAGIRPDPIIDLMEAFRRSKTMFTAVSIGVFEHLRAGAATAHELASRCAVEREPMQRLLDACAGLGLLEKTAGTYRNTDLASTYLLRDSPLSLAGYILYSDKILYPMWAHLDDAVRQGSNRFEQTFGPEAKGGIFQHLLNTEELARTFFRGMHSYGTLSSPEIVRLFNLARFRRVCDLGGGTGHLTIAACERYGAMEGILFDLPRALEQSRPFVAASRAAGRIRLHAGDFFEDSLPQADLYMLSRILHDWSEERIRRLLTKTFESLPPGGGILIVEMVLDEDRLGPVSALMQSLNMLVVTEGRERTFSEYRGLLEEAGFVNAEHRRTGAPHDGILALKPGELRNTIG